MLQPLRYRTVPHPFGTWSRTGAQLVPNRCATVRCLVPCRARGARTKYTGGGRQTMTNLRLRKEPTSPYYTNIFFVKGLNFTHIFGKKLKKGIILQSVSKMSNYSFKKIGRAERTPNFYVYLTQGERSEPENFSIRRLKGTILPRKLGCLLYTSPSPRDLSTSRMPSSA